MDTYLIIYENFTCYRQHKPSTLQKWIWARGEYIQGKEPNEFTGTAHHRSLIGSISVSFAQLAAILLLCSIIGQPAEAAGPHNLNFESSGNIFMVVVNKVEDSSVNSLCHHSVDFDGEST